MSREIAQMYRKMTDPEEQERERYREEEKAHVEDITNDAGL